MNVLSLFDGISCGQVALNRLGIKYDKYFASEIDEAAIKVTQNNYPETIQLGDVTKVRADDLPQIDILMGGSPCQGFSTQGKGINFDDSRSKLFFQFVRLLKECKPKWFLLENVHMKKEWADIISSQLGVHPIEINSKLLSAQMRKRMYWTNIPEIEQPQDKGLLLKDVKCVLPDDKYWKEKKINKYLNKEYKFKSLYSNVHNENQKTQCLCAVRGSAIPTERIGDFLFRELNPIEYERLQTLPDNYTKAISREDRFFAIGNGWTIDVICHIFNYLKTEMSKQESEN